MVLSKQLTDEQSNFLKFTAIVHDEFPKALRQAFKLRWDKKFGPGQPWDDSVAVRKILQAKETGVKNKIPTNKSYEEWDCTALFQATIYAQSFALRDKKGLLKTLGELYVKPRRLPHGSFHTSVMSPSGNPDETFALAIDQLRLLRNLLSHPARAQMNKIKFDQSVKRAKDAFQALGVKTDLTDDAVAEVDSLKSRSLTCAVFFFNPL